MRTWFLVLSIFVTIDILAIDLTQSVEPQSWDIECSDNTHEIKNDLDNQDQLNIGTELTEEDDANHKSDYHLPQLKTFNLQQNAHDVSFESVHLERMHQPPCLL
jgi:hypothetical protein